MAQLSLLNFPTLVNQQAAAAQAACTKVLNLAVGSVLRSIFEANASIGLWLQWLLLTVLSATRLATSFGADVDTWVGDFGLTRLPGTTSTGLVTLTSYTTTAQRLVVPGALLRTADGTQTFTVTTDITNAAWNVGLGGYALAPGTASVSVPVQCANVGTGGNVQAGAISLQASAIPGIDFVSNALAFVNGLNAETDAALKARFSSYIQSRSLATNGAVIAAVQGVQQGLTVVISENVPGPGRFIVTIDDGSGAPSSALQAAVAVAVNAVRPVGSIFSVQPPTIYSAVVNIVLTTAAGANHANLVGAVYTAVLAYVNGLPVGATLSFFNLGSVVKQVDPVNITGASITVNSVAADLVPISTGVVKISSLAVS